MASVSYGKARAGLLTPSEPCKGPLGYGLICTASDAEAWFEAGRQWSQFVRSLVNALKNKEPASSWPPEIAVTVQAAAVTAEQFDDEPWVAYEGDINKWAEAQQYLRDAASLLASRLADKYGLPVGTPGGLPAPGQIEPGVSKTAVALGVAGGVAIVAFTAWALTRPR